MSLLINLENIIYGGELVNYSWFVRLKYWSDKYRGINEELVVVVKVIGGGEFMEEGNNGRILSEKISFFVIKEWLEFMFW